MNAHSQRVLMCRWLTSNCILLTWVSNMSYLKVGQHHFFLNISHCLWSRNTLAKDRHRRWRRQLLRHWDLTCLWPPSGSRGSWERFLRSLRGGGVPLNTKPYVYLHEFIFYIIVPVWIYADMWQIMLLATTKHHALSLNISWHTPKLVSHGLKISALLPLFCFLNIIIFHAFIFVSLCCKIFNAKKIFYYL